LKKLNVLLVVCNNVLNGTERFVVDLARNLDKNKFNVFVALPIKGPLSEILKENNINEVIYDNGKTEYYSFKGLRNLYKIMKKYHIDIVHANSKFQPCLAGKLAGVKLNIETRHGIFYDKNQLENLPLLRKIYENLKQYFVDSFIAISENDKKTLIKYFKIKEKKISVIYLGLDLDTIKRKTTGIFKYRRIESGSEITIGHIGRFTYQKAQEYLLEAFNRLSLKYENVKLKIIGTGENKDKIIKFIAENKLESKIDLIDYTNDIYNEILKFDMHVLTSRYEGTPYVNFEAMALGVPVITTDTGGISNILKDKFDALITETGDPDSTFRAIESLITDEEYRKRIIENAFNTVKKFTVQNMAQNTEKFYLSML